MSEYWKSLPRKFCDICKCWFADNKASIDFHERGKRHKENAQKRILDIQKKGVKEFKKQQQMENEMEKIEKAALAAYKKDLQNMKSGENPEAVIQPTNFFTTPEPILKPKSKAHVKPIKKFQKKQVIIKKEDEVITKEEKKVIIKEEKEVVIKKEEVSDEEPTPQKVWYEAETEEGYKYYWNSETSESRWEPPEEGFISVEDQNKVKTETVTEDRQQKSPEESTCEITEGKIDCEDDLSNSIGPQPKVDPYGQWVTVEKKEPVKYDLQLPTLSENVVEVVIPVYRDSTSLKFKEKVVGQLSDTDCANVTFKKRKITSSSKKNARQRTTDDD